MKILCFGIAKEIIGTSEYQVTDTGITTVKALKSSLLENFSEFNQYKKFRIAVNQAFAEDEDLIKDTDEIAIIPPVSGG